MYRPETGEVIRNVRGCVTEAVLESMALVGSLANADGNPLGEGWNLAVLHHTDCSLIGCPRRAPALLAPHMGIQEADFDTVGIADSYKSMAFDVTVLKENHALPAGLTVSGTVYEVATGLVEMVVAAAPMRGIAA